MLFAVAENELAGNDTLFVNAEDYRNRSDHLATVIVLRTVFERTKDKTCPT